MKKFYFLSGVLLFSLMAWAQSEIRVLDSRMVDVNNEGNAVGPFQTFYNFSTDTYTVDSYEDLVDYFVISNDGLLIAEVYADSTDEVPNTGTTIGIKEGDNWTKLPFFNGETPSSSEYSAPNDISQNGRYIVGQMFENSDYIDFMFLYDLENAGSNPVQLTTIADGYDVAAAYGVSNDGLTVGWVDAIGGGTLRVPAMVNNSVITELTGDTGASSIFNQTSGISSDGTMAVGVLNNQPFTYDIVNDVFTLFSIPSGFETGAFLDIADNGIILGYYYLENYGREPILMHPNLGDAPVLLKDMMTENLGLSIPSQFVNSNSMGFPIKISDNGEFIVGFENSPVLPTSQAWIIQMDLGDLLGTEDIEGSIADQFVLYPNPAQGNNINLRLPESYSQNLEIMIHNSEGQLITQRQLSDNHQSVIELKKYIPQLSSGVYYFSIVTKSATIVKKIVVQ